MLRHSFDMRIILASRSPRRKELLSSLFSDFEIITADADESLGDMTPKEGVRVLAERKGRALFDMQNICGEELSQSLIISSDTLVEKDGVPYGKPTDEEDAYRMLSSLSGSRHNVHTGVAVHYRGRVYSGVATTEVRFFDIADEEIRAYIATGEPMDKAGAYGIQGGAGRFVEGIDGDFDTVVGLSVKLTQTLVDEALREGNSI